MVARMVQIILFLSFFIIIYARCDTLQPESFSDNNCYPEIKFYSKGVYHSVCLNSFITEGDSCVDLRMFLKTGYKDFFKNNKQQWSYNGFGILKNAEPENPSQFIIIDR